MDEKQKFLDTAKEKTKEYFILGATDEALKHVSKEEALKIADLLSSGYDEGFRQGVEAYKKLMSSIN